MRTVSLPGGEKVPALGQGTWNMGERPAARVDEVRALHRGLDLGMTLIDTAEMYAEGGAEAVVGDAIADRRDEVFLVSKVYPHNASATGVVRSCEASLQRLATDRLDLYLLHWRGTVPLAETMAGFERLRAAGKIRHWGVSNLDVDDMAELVDGPGGAFCATDQVLYNLTRREPEHALLPWCAARGMPIMAYSPIEQGRLPTGGAMAAVARKHDVTPFVVGLAWVLRRPDIIAIPKAVNPRHVEANRRALDLTLDADDLRALDQAFPPPVGKRPIAML